jgi:ribosomal protein S18 acetylase RimI-like enzyme
MPKLLIRQANSDDLESILDIQKSAYQSEAEIYNDFSIQPLTQTLDDIQDEFDTHIFLIALGGDEIIGTVRAVQKGQTCYVGKLAVKPEMQNLGIGRRLMHEIELWFPNVKRFEIFTGHKSNKNLHLYSKLGYVVYSKKPINDSLTLCFLEKCVS